jgi:hypothetical protein
MAIKNILKGDSHGKITLPPGFRSVREFPDMSDLPEESLSQESMEMEVKVNKDKRKPISTSSPSEALKRLGKK